MFHLPCLRHSWADWGHCARNDCTGELTDLCVARYRALAGHALRALRLDLMLMVLHHLQELPGNCWACKEEDAVEVPSPLPFILAPSNPCAPAHAHSYPCLRNLVHHTERATLTNADYC